jgi:hypothetical protein
MVGMTKHLMISRSDMRVAPKILSGLGLFLLMGLVFSFQSACVETLEPILFALLNRPENSGYIQAVRTVLRI